MTDYTPIDCGRYSEYELAIMHRQRLRLAWQGSGGIMHVAVVRPRDLYTRQGEEFMLVTDAAGATLEIRLDRILDSKPVQE